MTKEFQTVPGHEAELVSEEIGPEDKEKIINQKKKLKEKIEEYGEEMRKAGFNFIEKPGEGVAKLEEVLNFFEQNYKDIVADFEFTLPEEAQISSMTLDLFLFKYIEYALRYSDSKLIEENIKNKLKELGSRFVKLKKDTARYIEANPLGDEIRAKGGYSPSHYSLGQINFLISLTGKSYEEIEGIAPKEEVLEKPDL